ncbi:MAG: 3-phosphoshikimate 1-carboxyvinyltransferase, partial [Pirellulaceae bacterium]|nr:3-phosphoshikimate 1-carboxyvinyltransferase [Pirellulaceae bacterium]
MNDRVEIRPRGPARGSIRPPGSKSITNRALVCAALADGESLLAGALDCDDTRAMAESLRLLGATIEHDPAAATMRVVGCGGDLAGGRVELFAGGSGTTARFLTALAAIGRGTYRIDGSPQMRGRPMGDLLDALDQLGADAAAENGDRRLPLVVRGRGLRGGRAALQSGESSQFLSGLLMASPYAGGDVALTVAGALVSRPYVDMTRAVMASFGVEVEERPKQRFAIAAPRRYRARRYEIEPDATAAGYFFAAAAVTGGEATVEGLSRGCLQGDLELCECLWRMGCEVIYGSDRVTVRGRPLHGIDVDMNSISDAAPTLAVAALFAAGPTTIRGIAHVRHKESDRIGALAVELRKLGAAVIERADGLTISPGPLRAAEVDPHGDHRQAMSLAVAGLSAPGV